MRLVAGLAVAIVGSVLVLPVNASAAQAAACGPTGIAHRSRSGDKPENTLRASRAALATGVRTLEGDVRFTSDMVPVLMHDSTVDRTTNGTGAVASLTWDRIRRLDAGDGARVPRLLGIADLASRRHAKLVLELKPDIASRAQVRRFVKIIRSKSMVSSTTVESFHSNNLRLVHDIAPGMTTGLITRRAVSRAEARRAGSVVLPKLGVVSRSLVRSWHGAGLAVYAWTADERGEWRTLNQARVDAIITNRPGQYRRWQAAGC